MKHLLSILFALLAFTVNVQAQNVNEAAVKKQINAFASKMRSMQCDFVQTKTMKMLGSTMTSKGKMYYQQSNKLRWEYTSPYTYVFVINNNQVMLNKGKGSSQVIDVNQSKVFKEITRIMMNSVVGKCLDNSGDFKTSVAASGSDWVVTMVPQKKNLKQMFNTIKVYFNKQRSMVSRVIITEKNGDTTNIELKNAKTNVTLQSSLFNVR